MSRNMWVWLTLSFILVMASGGAAGSGKSPLLCVGTSEPSDQRVHKSVIICKLWCVVSRFLMLNVCLFRVYCLRHIVWIGMSKICCISGPRYLTGKCLNVLSYVHLRSAVAFVIDLQVTLMFQIKNSSKQPILAFCWRFSLYQRPKRQQKVRIGCFDEFLIWNVYQPDGPVRAPGL